MATRTILPAGAAALAVTVLASACETSRSVQRLSGSAMGTSYDVVVEFTGAEPDTTPIGRLVEDELTRLNDVLSTYLPESDLSRFSSRERTDPVEVDPTLLDVLERALEVSRLSGGAFDPTVAPLVDVWGFGPSDVPPPDTSEVEALRPLVGWERLVLDPAAGTVAKTDGGVRIDLSGAAKGYAAQYIALKLQELGYESVLVDVGGELRVVGSHADGRPWRVAVEGPGAAAPELLGTIDLVDEAIATSGDFRNYYEYGGVVYAHIIDPRTGYPVRFRGFSVTVVHPDATMADAWATALTVLGPDEGYDVAERQSLAALFAWRGAGGIETRETSRMRGRVNPVE